ncbi:MAG: RNA-binding protein, partial [Flavipsychrobacter sp.]|nr:RNA-binding protein [Flavipsychrobacter sp.]
MNLYVGNLSPETTEGDLRTLFSEFGEIVSVKILLDAATGLPRGFGFVEMADKYHGYDAITNLDMTYVQGNIINVRESKPKGTDNRSGGGGFNRGGNRSGGGGNFNRNRTNSSGGSYNRERNYNDRGTGGYNRERNYNNDNASGGYNRERNYNSDSNNTNTHTG